MVGFVPEQSDTRLFGGVPSSAAGAAQLVRFHLFASDDEIRHLADTSGVGACGVGVLANQTSTFRADPWQIARHPGCKLTIVAKFGRRE